MSPNVAAGGLCTRADDMFLLALTFAHLRRISVPHSETEDGKLDLVRRLAESHTTFKEAFTSLV